MMQGRYRDTVADRAGRPLAQGPWRSNAIVDSCWPLLAALLKGEPGMQGILFWAVGAGDPAWDAVLPPPNPQATGLRDEVARVPVKPDDMAFLDAQGHRSASPTPRLELRVRFRWTEPRTLREFGVFGGDATEQAGSGTLLNYVMHPRVDLGAGKQLQRRLRFSFDPQPREAASSAEPPAHWLGGREPLVVDGVGAATAAALQGAGVLTVDDLARTEPLKLDGVASLTTRVQLRSRARLLLRVASEMRPAPGFLSRTAWDVLVTPVATLAADAGAPVDEAARLREQVGALELALDHRFLRSLTVGQLAQPGPGGPQPKDEK
jgi:hypothetical protein